MPSSQQRSFRDTLISQEAQVFDFGASNYSTEVERRLTFVDESFQRDPAAVVEAEAILLRPLSALSVTDCEKLKLSEYREKVSTSARMARMQRFALPSVLFTETRPSALFRATKFKMEGLHRLVASILAVTGRASSNGRPWLSKFVTENGKLAGIKVTLEPGDDRWGDFYARLAAGPLDVSVEFEGSGLKLRASRPDLHRPEPARRATVELKAEELAPEEVFAALEDKLGGSVALFGTRMVRNRESGLLAVTLPMAELPGCLLTSPSLDVDGRKLALRFPGGPPTCSTCFATGHATRACPQRPPPPAQQQCTICKAKGHMAERCWRAHLSCYYCGAAGHIKKFCPEIECSGCRQLGHMRVVCKQMAPVEQQASTAAAQQPSSGGEAAGQRRSSSLPPARPAAPPVEGAAQAAQQPKSRVRSRTKRKRRAAATGAAREGSSAEAPPALLEEAAGSEVDVDVSSPPDATPARMAAASDAEQPTTARFSLPGDVSVDNVLFVYDFCRVDPARALKVVDGADGAEDAVELGGPLLDGETVEHRRLNVEILRLAVQQLGGGAAEEEVKQNILELLQKDELLPLDCHSTKRSRANGSTPESGARMAVESPCNDFEDL